MHNRRLTLAIVGFGTVGQMAAKFANYFGFEVTIFSHATHK
jgi:phosphoglycerate dehydrogenase-like enzyme